MGCRDEGIFGVGGLGVNFQLLVIGAVASDGS